MVNADVSMPGGGGCLCVYFVPIYVSISLVYIILHSLTCGINTGTKMHVSSLLHVYCLSFVLCPLLEYSSNTCGTLASLV